MITGTQPLARFLGKLKVGPTPSSEVRKSDLSAISNLEDLGFLSKQKRGNGQVYVLNDCHGYRQWEANIFPEGTESASLSGKSRSEAGKTLRDTKLSSQTSPFLEMRLHSSQKCMTLGSMNWYYQNSDYKLNGTVVLIENLRTFLKSEIIFPESEVVIRYDGIISDVIIEILSNSDCKIIIAPDYDPVGVLSYIRLKDKISDRTEFYLPKNLNDLFSSYSNRKLMSKSKNKSTLRSLLNRDLDEPSAYVIQLIQKYNAGLEQETLHN